MTSLMFELPSRSSARRIGRPTMEGKTEVPENNNDVKDQLKANEGERERVNEMDGGCEEGGREE